MNKEEFDYLVNEFKKQGLTDEDMLNAFFKMFEQGKVDATNLVAMVNWLGYELDDEFYKENNIERKNNK